MKTNTQSTDNETILFNEFERYWLEHNTCCLCGTELHFHHKTDWNKGEIEEHAHCPSCRVRTRAQNHTLQ